MSTTHPLLTTRLRMRQATLLPPDTVPVMAYYRVTFTLTLSTKLHSVTSQKTIIIIGKQATRETNNSIVSMVGWLPTSWLPLKQIKGISGSSFSKIFLKSASCLWRISGSSSGRQILYMLTGQHFCIILSMPNVWLYSLSTNKCTYYTNIYFTLSGCYMFRPVTVHRGLTTKQWQQQSTDTQTNRYAHGKTKNFAQSPGALQTSKT